MLVKNLERIKSSCTLNQLGLSNESASKALFKNEAISGLASIYPRNLSYLGIDLRKIEEQCLFENPIAYCEKNKIKQIDLLKLDIEGSELIVLKAFESFFRKKQIKLCQFEVGSANIETRVLFHDFFCFFKDLDYRLGILRPNGKIEPILKYEEKYENMYAYAGFA